MATSVPVTPMATPMSAALRAGASFTPSPVMATTSPLPRRALTMRSLWKGETRANTLVRSMAASSWASSISSSSDPDTTRSPSR